MASFSDRVQELVGAAKDLGTDLAITMAGRDTPTIVRGGTIIDFEVLDDGLVLDLPSERWIIPFSAIARLRGTPPA